MWVGGKCGHNHVTQEPHMRTERPQPLSAGVCPVTNRKDPLCVVVNAAWARHFMSKLVCWFWKLDLWFLQDCFNSVGIICVQFNLFLWMYSMLCEHGINGGEQGLFGSYQQNQRYWEVHPFSGLLKQHSVRCPRFFCSIPQCSINTKLQTLPSKPAGEGRSGWSRVNWFQFSS